jgi:undecaprenyl-phosphate 4-deoxy-4-formamido-L-arabinose transferase
MNKETEPGSADCGADNPPMKNLSVVIPVYNSSLSLSELRGRLVPVLRQIANDYEIILVDDNSRDNSWQVVQQLAAHDEHIRGMRLSRNFGQHNALLCGIRAARHETIVTMDDDLQHPPEEIPILLEKLAEGYDVVYGKPQEEQHGVLRDVASQLTKIALHRAIGVEVARNVSAFRAFHTHLRDVFADYRGSFVSIDVLLSWATTRFAYVRVRHDPRTSGESNYTMRKLLTHALNMVTGFSTLPLQIASVVGFFFFFFGVGVIGYVISRYFIVGTTVPGFTFLASIVSIFAGAQLLALGIIGEYLARMYFRMMGRPTYAINEATPPHGDGI